MTKKILTLILCALMIVGILPISAFALSYDDVVSIAITGIEAPVAGEEPDYTCTEDTLAGSVPYYTYENDDDMVKTIYGKTWFDKTENQRPLKRGETFVAGHVYILAVSVVTKGEYNFITEAVPMEGTYSRVSATVNGEKAKVVVPTGYDPKKHAVVRYEFAPCPNRQIEQVFFPDIVAPRVGEKPVYISSKDSVSHGGGFTSYENFDNRQTIMYGKTWIDVDNGFTAMNMDDTFKAGHRYAIDIYVCPTPGNEFKSLSTINAKINGKQAHVLAVEGYDYNEVVCIRYEFSECRGDAVSFIDASITAPVAGEKPSYVVECNSGNFSIGDFNNPVYSRNGVMWFRDENNSVMMVDGANVAFEDGKSYTAKINFVADQGYSFSEDLCILLNGEAVEFERIEDTGVILSRSFTIGANAGENEGPVVYENPFTDVDEGKWYTEGILWSYKNGYMAGLSDTLFGRKSNVTRAMFVTILAKIDNADTSSYTEMSFSDVPAGQWYSNAIEWAASNGYAAGIGGGMFGRKADVSREQIALFFYTYASLNSINVSGTVDLSGYTDYADIHSWALKGVEWAVAEGLIAGVGENTLAPRASATRGEIALIVKNFVENVLNAASIPFGIVEHPEDFRMAGSMDASLFTVKIVGGKAPYTYTWYTVFDGVENAVAEDQSASKVNSVFLEFTDYDFDHISYGIEVYCLVTDAEGAQLETDRADVFQKDMAYPLGIVEYPSPYYMGASVDVATFNVEVHGGTAPYTYKWTLYGGSTSIYSTTVVTEEKRSTFGRAVSDYDFDEYFSVYAVCEITDSLGATVTTSPALVVFYKPLNISKQPADYYMSSSMEEADFTVKLSGGVAPYTYEWYLVYDNNEIPVQPVLSDETSDTFKYEFSDYDFDYYNNIGVYCIITDAKGNSVQSELAEVFQKR